MKKLLFLSLCFFVSGLLNAAEKSSVSVGDPKATGSMCRNAFLAYLKAYNTNFKGLEEIENILAVCKEMDGNAPLTHRVRAEQFRREKRKEVAVLSFYRFENQRDSK